MVEKLREQISWNEWKETQGLGFISNGVEALLKRIYEVRRTIQKGEIGPDAWDDLIEELDESQPSFFEENREVVELIVQTTLSEIVRDRYQELTATGKYERAFRAKG